jgi:hypothetical protein
VLNPPRGTEIIENILKDPKFVRLDNSSVDLKKPSQHARPSPVATFVRYLSHKGTARKCLVKMAQGSDTRDRRLLGPAPANTHFRNEISRLILVDLGSPFHAFSQPFAGSRPTPPGSGLSYDNSKGRERHRQGDHCGDCPSLPLHRSYDDGGTAKQRHDADNQQDQEQDK